MQMCALFEGREMSLNLTTQVKEKGTEKTYASYHRRPCSPEVSLAVASQKAASEDRTRCACKPSEGFTLVISSVLSKAGAGDWLQTHRIGHMISLCDLRSHLSLQRTDEVSRD